ncbi:MAG: amino acid kinase [Methanosarcinaceae archaeon]|nr:amino acid kinase [Methanosarcinaceae archaeon]
MKVVVKIGGSLIVEGPEIIKKLLEQFGRERDEGRSGRSPEECDRISGERAAPEGCDNMSEKKAAGKEEVSILIVPGGGMFADAVRAADEMFGIGNEAAHWMAVLSMEQYAYYLMEKSGAEGTASLEIPLGAVRVLLPYRLLKKEDPLPHSWDVTSDSIAAWVARRRGAKLVKVTDVDGVFRDGKLLNEVSAAELARLEESCTDPALPDFLLKNRMDCVIVNGKFPERVVGALSGKPVRGTVVKGNI